MIFKVFCPLAVLLLTANVSAHDPKGFDDTVLHTLAWHGKDELLVSGIVPSCLLSKVKNIRIINESLLDQRCRRRRDNRGDYKQGKIQMHHSIHCNERNRRRSPIQWSKSDRSTLSAIHTLFLQNRELLDLRGLSWQLHQAVPRGAARKDEQTARILSG